MDTDKIQCSTKLPVDRAQLFRDWLDSQAHTAFTGSAAVIDAKAGGIYSAWDGYITGKTLEIDPPRRILQTWRTTEFADLDPDSLLEVLFEELDGSTKLILNHSGIPGGEGEGYRQGWEEFYFTPMQKFYTGK